MNLKDFFSNQEIDILACLLNNSSVKNASLLLGVAPETIETSFNNLLLRLQCNSLEQLKDMMAEANMLQDLQQHYINVLGQTLEPKTAGTTSKGPIIMLCFFIILLIVLASAFLIHVKNIGKG